MESFIFSVIIFFLFNATIIGISSGEEHTTSSAAPVMMDSQRDALGGLYVGCYALGCLNFDYDIDSYRLILPSTCTASCKKHGFPLAGVYNGTKCSCACQQTCLTKLDDDDCGLPCQEAPIKLCGGYTTVSVYNVNLSEPLNDKYCSNRDAEVDEGKGEKLLPTGETTSFAGEFLDSEWNAHGGLYIGCYAFGCFIFDYDIDESYRRITPSSCTASCKEHGYPLAGVYNGSKCSCACEHTCLTKPLDDKTCGLPCRDPPTKFCGGYTAVSIYEVTLPNAPLRDNCNNHHHEIEENTTTSGPTLLAGIPIIPILIAVGAFMACNVCLIIGCVLLRKMIRRGATNTPPADSAVRDSPPSYRRFLETNVDRETQQFENENLGGADEHPYYSVRGEADDHTHERRRAYPNDEFVYPNNGPSNVRSTTSGGRGPGIRMDAAGYLILDVTAPNMTGHPESGPAVSSLNVSPEGSYSATIQRI